MSDKILDETILDDEPLSAEALLRNLLEDVIADNSAEEIASEFVDEFVLRDRPETSHILAMLETPSEALVEFLKGLVAQSYQVQLQALDARGVRFANELKAAVRERMTALAS